MGAEDRYGLCREGRSPMIKSIVAAAGLSVGLFGYATAQEAAPAAPAPNYPQHYYDRRHHSYPHHYYHHHHHHYLPPGPASSTPRAAPQQ